MTVKEMIIELQKIADAGNGDAIMVSQIISDWGDEKIDFIEYEKKRNGEKIVNVYT